ncbi:MAG: cobalamin biosynthesis protein, partial [Pseudomonadota bacterium]
MFWSLNLAACLIALGLDALVGDPARVWTRVPHPVVWIGRVIGWADARFNPQNREIAEAARRRLGLLLVVLLVGGAVGVGTALSFGLRQLPLGWVLEGALASTLIAQRSLHEHVEAVLDGLLSHGLAGGRRAIAHIVGRDPQTLDLGGIVRAGIESL